MGHRTRRGSASPSERLFARETGDRGQCWPRSFVRRAPRAGLQQWWDDRVARQVARLRLPWRPASVPETGTETPRRRRRPAWPAGWVARRRGRRCGRAERGDRTVLPLPGSCAAGTRRRISDSWSPVAGSLAVPGKPPGEAVGDFCSNPARRSADRRAGCAPLARGRPAGSEPIVAIRDLLR
jgi:hypothetical protein